MDGFFLFENQMPLLDNVIQSTNQLMPILYHTDSVNDTIRTTIDQIFSFVSQILTLLPDILMSVNQMKNVKQELIASFNDVRLKWQDFDGHSEYLERAWMEFMFWWKEFLHSLENITNGKTIILSMN